MIAIVSSTGAVHSGGTGPDIVSPELGSDLPADGVLYAHNQFSVTGWAVGADSVRVMLGAVSAVSGEWLASPDVHACFPELPGSDKARFAIDLDTSACPRGMHTMTVTAAYPGGHEQHAERTVIVEPYETPDRAELAASQHDRIALACDSPAPGQIDELSAPLSIHGWSYSKGGVDRLRVFLDGREEFDVIYPTLRLDVRDHLGVPEAALSGFQLLLEPEQCAPGEHSVTILATHNAGRVVGSSAMFRCVDRSEAAENGLNGHLSTDLANGERFVPEVHSGTTLELDHVARYRWAQPLAQSRSVLDVACGTGYGTALLAQAGATRIVGVDLNRGAIESARRRAGDLAEFALGDLYELPFADAEFDLVVCFETIEHVSDPRLALGELRRVLSPDGILAISTPNRDVYSAHGALNPWHRRELNGPEFESMLREHFEHVRVWGQDAFSGSAVGDVPAIASDEAAFNLTVDPLAVEPVPHPDAEFMVALASGGQLPRLPGVMLVGPCPETHESILNLGLRVDIAEAHATASVMELNVIQAMYRSLVKKRYELERKLSATDARAASAERLLAEHRNSASWRLTRPLRVVKQLARRARS